MHQPFKKENPPSPKNNKKIMSLLNHGNLLETIWAYYCQNSSACLAIYETNVVKKSFGEDFLVSKTVLLSFLLYWQR
jgi:hypothetical protein